MISIKNITKTFNTSLHALNNVSVDIEDGSIFGVIGLSGAGKSTFLRSIALLEKVDCGSIIIDNEDLTKFTKKEIYNFRQHIGVVFQGYNLLMQRNVFENIAIPLKIRKLSKEEINKKVSELISLVGLNGKELEYPCKLSGGQCQRVAIARALATNPKILLLDEFTSALDPITTKQVIELIKKINKDYQMTIIIITHEMNIAASICDAVMVLNYGEVVEWGKISDVIDNPVNDVTKLLLGRKI